MKWLLASLLLAGCAAVGTSTTQTTSTAPPTPPVNAPRMSPPTIPPYSGSGEPLDILIVGDSTAFGIDVFLRQIMANHGYPGTVTTDWVGSTGIAGYPPPQYPQVDWVARIEADLAAHQPDVIVAEWVGSFDANPPHDTITRGTAFAVKVRAAGAQLVMVRTPAVRDAAPGSYYDTIIAALDAIPADSRADWRTLLSPGNKWTEYGTTDRGVERIRTDELHIDAAGRRLAAHATMAALVPHWS